MAANILQRSRRETKIGRPSRYSLELGEKIAYLIGLGLKEWEAASAHDLPYDTLKTWMRVHPELNDMVAKAQAIALKTQLEKLTNSDDTRNTQFWLERCTLDKQRFCDPRIGLQLNIQNNLNVTPGLGMTPDQLREERERLDRLQAIPGKPGQLNPYVGSTDPADLDAYIAHLQKLRAELPDTPRDRPATNHRLEPARLKDAGEG